MALPSSIPPFSTRLTPNQRPQKKRRPRRRRSVTSKTILLNPDSSRAGSSKTVLFKPSHLQTTAVELSASLMVTGILMTASVTSLLRLAPLLHEQRAELHQAQADLAVTEARNYRLKADFGRYFDPRLARQVMQEQSSWKAPAQRQVVWIAPESLEIPSGYQPKDKNSHWEGPRFPLGPASD